MKNYLVVMIEDVNDYFVVNDLKALITEMYEPDLEDNSFEVVERWFYEGYKVFVSESEIEEVSK
jgi:hypothetical protein